MKTTFESLPETQEMPDEYHLDYNKAKLNRFADRVGQTRVRVALDPDVAVVFKTQEEVNTALRTLIASMPNLK